MDPAHIAWVVVLGDYGRSPRMQYHSMSLSTQAGLEVHVLATGGSEPFAAIAKDDNIHVHLMPDTPRALQRLPRAVLLLLRPLLQAVMMLWMMVARLPRPALILLQLPPAIPTMAVVSFAAWWHNAKLLYDWHNFGYTLMALNLGRNHWLVEMAEKYERFWAPRAWGSLCVSKAMQQELASRWQVKAALCYDRPPEHFAPTSIEQVHNLMLRLGVLLREAVHPSDCLSSLYAADDAARWPPTVQQVTPLTTCNRRRGVRRRDARPAVVVSSTSWTPDEDFGVLLEAIRLYDHQAMCHPALPPLLVIVTGRGPLLAEFKSRLSRLDLRRCSIRTTWLAASDYPLLLGLADVGVCLHASSSGLDLPMKVLDMFGCQLPVCAMEYETIGELVTHGDNGLLFSNSEQLAKHLQELLLGFPTRLPKLMRRLQRSHMQSREPQWAAAWQQRVLPIVRQALMNERFRAD